MSRRYFGTDGIRGCVGDAAINVEFFLKLGWAVGCVLSDTAHRTILVGRDTRVSGEMLQSALEAGLAAAGCQVVDVGVLPTPAVAYLAQSMRTQGGMMVSASHNPFHDNGIKIFDHQGMKLSDEQELHIEQQLDLPLQMVSPDNMFSAQSMAKDAESRYIEFCKSTFPAQLNLEGLRIVVDAANGAMSAVAPIVLRELGAEVITVGCQPDGFNINVGCGSLYPDTLQARVLAEKADIGVALDGDGDRVLLVDHTGTCVDGDEILCILASEKATGLRSHAGVVGTLMSNLGLEKSLTNMGVAFERAQVGDRYVLETLIQKGWTLGGENSGHVIDLDYTTTGDGLVTACQVLRAMQLQQATLQTLKSGMLKRPQVLKNIRFKGDAAAILSHPRVLAAVSEMEDKLAGRGRVLLRPSGTEPLVRVMGEGDDLTEVTAVVDALVAVIESVSQSTMSSS